MVLFHLVRCTRCHAPLASVVYVDDYSAACDLRPAIACAEWKVGGLAIARTLPTYLLTPKTDNGHEPLRVHQLWSGTQDSLTVEQLIADLQQLQQQHRCA
jgi:hypothetical protein